MKRTNCAKSDLFWIQVADGTIRACVTLFCVMQRGSDLARLTAHPSFDKEPTMECRYIKRKSTKDSQGNRLVSVNSNQVFFWYPHSSWNHFSLDASYNLKGLKSYRKPGGNRANGFLPGEFPSILLRCSSIFSHKKPRRDHFLEPQPSDSPGQVASTHPHNFSCPRDKALALEDHVVAVVPAIMDDIWHCPVLATVGLTYTLVAGQSVCEPGQKGFWDVAPVLGRHSSPLCKVTWLCQSHMTGVRVTL